MENLAIIHEEESQKILNKTQTKTFPRNSEMTPGKAAGIASAVWLVLIFAIAGYFFFFRGSSAEGFANPVM